MKTLALIFDGFEELEAIAPFALMRRAKLDLTIASARTEVIGTHKIHFSDMIAFDTIDYTSYDALLLPGGAHYQFLEKNPIVHEIITHFMDNHKYVFAICASPTILGKLGYLKNRHYTCFTSMNEDFGGTYVDTGVVVDKNLITGRSAAASIDFAYQIILALGGNQLLQDIQQRIYYEK